MPVTAPSASSWRLTPLLVSALVACPLLRIEAQEAARPRVVAEGPARVFLPVGGNEADPVIEASAVGPIGEGRLWLVGHDKAPGLVVVDTATGRRVGEPLTASGFPLKSEFDGPKWEGMAIDDQGHYYVIGSHSGKAEERQARSVLLRFRLSGDGTPGRPVAIDPDSVARLHVAESLEAALNGLGLGPKAVDKRKIEGLAFRATRDESGQVARRELVIGLREPDDLVRVFAADITQSPDDGSRLDLSFLFGFDAGEAAGVPMTLTSLEHVEALGGFLAITSTEDDDNVFHGNALWFIPDAQAPTISLPAASREASPTRLLDFEPTMKAEGLAVLPGTPPGGPIRLALVFDNDPLKTNIPSRLQVLRLTPSNTRP